MELRAFVKHPVILLAVVWMALAVVSYCGVPEDSDDYWWYAYIFYLGAPTIAAVVTLYVARFYGFKGVEGKVWTLIGAGMVLWMVGEYMWFHYTMILETDPFPSAADYLYIAGYAPLLIGFYFKAKESLVRVNAKRLAVIFGVVCITAIIAAFYVIVPLMGAEDYGGLEKGIGLSYPLLDLVIVAFSIAILTAFWESSDASKGWILFSAGMMAMTAADIVFSAADWQGVYYAQMDLLWIGAYLLFASGAMYQYLLHKSFTEG